MAHYKLQVNGKTIIKPNHATSLFYKADDFINL